MARPRKPIDSIGMRSMQVFRLDCACTVGWGHIWTHGGFGPKCIYLRPRHPQCPALLWSLLCTVPWCWSRLSWSIRDHRASLFLALGDRLGRGWAFCAFHSARRSRRQCRRMRWRFVAAMLTSPVVLSGQLGVVRPLNSPRRFRRRLHSTRDGKAVAGCRLAAMICCAVTTAVACLPSRGRDGLSRNPMRLSAAKLDRSLECWGLGERGGAGGHMPLLAPLARLSDARAPLGADPTLRGRRVMTSCLGLRLAGVQHVRSCARAPVGRLGGGYAEDWAIPEPELVSSLYLRQARSHPPLAAQWLSECAAHCASHLVWCCSQFGPSESPRLGGGTCKSCRNRQWRRRRPSASPPARARRRRRLARTRSVARVLGALVGAVRKTYGA